MALATTKILKAMGEQNRLRVLHLCRSAHLTLNDLSKILSVSLSGLTFHMNKLESEGLIMRSKERTKVFFRLTQDVGVRRLIDAVLELAGPEDPIFASDTRKLNELLKHNAEQASSILSSYVASWNEDRNLYADEQLAEKLILKHLTASKPKHFLDVGTGTGRLLTAVSGVVEVGEGVDISHDMLAIARDAIAQNRLENLAVRFANMFTLPFEPNSFEAVSLYQVLHFADDPFAAILACAKMVASGGELIIADFLPHDESILTDKYGHHWLGFSDDQIQGWLKE
ncbi:MAG: ArsR/SmtB family transcription factor, partial [Alphaproteobacteria bacterium]